MTNVLMTQFDIAEYLDAYPKEAYVPDPPKVQTSTQVLTTEMFQIGSPKTHTVC